MKSAGGYLSFTIIISTAVNKDNKESGYLTKGVKGIIMKATDNSITRDFAS